MIIKLPILFSIVKLEVTPPIVIIIIKTLPLAQVFNRSN